MSVAPSHTNMCRKHFLQYAFKIRFFLILVKEGLIHKYYTSVEIMITYTSAGACVRNR